MASDHRPGRRSADGAGSEAEAVPRGEPVRRHRYHAARRRRAKERHLEHDRRASLLVVDPDNAYRWVAVSGPAEVTEEGADSQIDKLAKKYLGKDEYPFRNPAETRVKVLIEPERVDSSGFEN
jgi:PPOX class probable F420-dependent enzyme